MPWSSRSVARAESGAENSQRGDHRERDQGLPSNHGNLLKGRRRGCRSARLAQDRVHARTVSRGTWPCMLANASKFFHRQARPQSPLRRAARERSRTYSIGSQRDQPTASPYCPGGAAPAAMVRDARGFSALRDQRGTISFRAPIEPEPKASLRSWVPGEGDVQSPRTVFGSVTPPPRRGFSFQEAGAVVSAIPERPMRVSECTID
jgi:hypothetical protein